MKRKIKSVLLVFGIYILLNGLVWGFMKVYMESYNTMNKDQIVMAEINFRNDDYAEISVLEEKYNINLHQLKNNKKAYITAYMLSSVKFKFIVQLISEIHNYAPL